MFNTEFFPTPLGVASRMWSEVENCSYILEPSAGKGDLLRPGEDRRRRGYGPRIDVIEQNPELQMILRGSGYNLIHDDFLTFEPRRRYDGIVMNPPFSTGVEHLLRAWEIVAAGGKVVCLLNTNTVMSAIVGGGTKKGAVIGRFLGEFGQVEDLGQCFVDAERKTKVNVSIVILGKKDDGREFGFFDEVTSERQAQSFGMEESQSCALDSPDTIGTMVGMYENALAAHVELLRAKNKVMFYTQYLTNQISQSQLIISDLKSDQDQYNRFVDELTGKCWDAIFERTDIGRFVTSGVREDFEKFRDGNKVVDFSRKNIEIMLRNLGMSVSSIMEEALLKIFDELTRYDKKNMCHWEGWATNDAWRVNRKVIVPNIVDCDKWTGQASLSYFWRGREFLDDIDRVMCSLTGKNYNEVKTIQSALTGAFPEWGHNPESEFFTIRYYKKGTVHLTFKSERLLMDFNRAAAKGKNWLPGER